MKTIPAEQIEQLPAVRVTNAQYEALYHEGMQGCIRSITVDFLEHTAIVTTAGGCVDMTGCIAVVMMLDPNIENIQTIDGGAFTERRSKDTQYIKDPERGWLAVCWERSTPTRGEYCGTDFAVKALQSLLLAALRASKKRRCAP